MIKPKFSIFVIAVFCALPCVEGRPQSSPANVIPMITLKTDVARALGEGHTMGQNRAAYDYQDKRIEITFYKQGCSGSELNILPDTVLEVKVVPKTPQRFSDFITDASNYQRHIIPDKRFLYFSRRDGIVVMTKSDKKNLEYIEKVYFGPPESKFADCLVESFDDNSGLAALSFFGVKSIKGDKFDLPPTKIGTYFEEDSKATKDELVAEFIQNLSDRQNSFGFIIMFAPKSESFSTTLKRRNQLLEHLKAKGIPCTRLIFSELGIGPLSGTTFSIVHRSFLLQNKVKAQCN